MNVDDVGLHPAVQRAVELLAERGIVTSASVLSNGPCVKEARRLQGIGLAAHLNILRGRPVSSPHEVKSLVKHGQFFNDAARLFEKYLLRQLRLTEVELEWGRQIELLLDMGLRLTHLDSEKHVHCWPRLMPIACRLAERYGLGWVRRTVERTSAVRWDSGAMKARLLNSWGVLHRQHPGVRWPDAVWGVADGGTRLTAARLKAYLPRISCAQVLEIVCHPGLARPTDGPTDDSFGPLRVESNWEAEFHSLLEGEWNDVFAAHRLQPGHYGESRQRSAVGFQRKTTGLM